MLVTGDSNEVTLLAVLLLEGGCVSVDSTGDVKRVTLAVEIEGEEVDEPVLVDKSSIEQHGEGEGPQLPMSSVCSVN